MRFILVPNVILLTEIVDIANGVYCWHDKCWHDHLNIIKKIIWYLKYATLAF